MMRFKIQLLTLLALACVTLCWAEVSSDPTITSSDLPWVERYRKALEVDPDNAALRYQLGLSLLAAGDNAEAVQELHRAYPSLSQTIGINFNLGLAYTKLNDPDSALLYLEQAETSGALNQQEIYPLASALYNVALVYLDTGEQDAAIAVLRHVVELAPERRDLMRLYGELLFRAGHMTAAQEELLRYLAIYPDDSQVRETLFALHYNRGLELMEKQRSGEAEQAFTRALAVAPESPMALYYLAYLDYLAQRPAEVVRHLAATVTTFPADIQRSSFPLLYSAAQQLLQEGQYELASQGVKPLVTDGSSEVRSLYLAGRIALKQGEIAAARDLLSRVLSVEPAHVGALKLLVDAEHALARLRTDEGQQLYRQGDLQGAYRLFLEAQELNPRDAKLRAYLKDTSRKLAAASDHQFDQAEQAEAAGDSILALKYVRAGRQLWGEAPRGVALERRLIEGLDLELARQLLEAQSLLAMQEYPRALDAFVMLLEIDPDNEDARQGYEQVRSAIEQQLELRLGDGREALESGDLDRAAQAFDEVLVQRPEHVAALEGLERIAALRTAMTDEELQWARRAFTEGDYAAARQHFQNVLGQLDTPPLRNEYLAFESAVEKRLAALLEAARAARAEHDFRKALRLYRQARKVAADPESLSAEFDATLREAEETMVALLLQAQETLEAGEAGRSVQLLRAVLRIEPSQAQALDLLQRARQAAGAEAQKLLAEGRRFEQQDEPAKARQAYASALQIDPYLQPARAALDEIDLRARKLSQAQVERLYLEGVAYYTQGEYRQAMTNWRQVLEIDTGHEKARRNLDKAERKLQQLKERAQ